MAQSRFLDKFLTWFGNTTDAPFEFGTLAGLSAISTIALGRRWIDHTKPLHSNIFGMIVADSGVARKGTALARALALIEEVEPERIGPNDYTSESLFKWMSENKNSNNKGREKVALFADEFGADLARMQSYAGTMKGDFCRLYDCVPINKIRMTGGAINVPNPRVTFMAACAYQMMVAGLNHNDWNTGYLMRFLFVAPLNLRQRFLLPPDPQPALQQRAKVALEAIRDSVFMAMGPMRLSDGAKSVYSKSITYHEYFMMQSNEVVQVYTGRFWTNILKLSLLYQLDEDPTVSEISESAMCRAVQFGIEVCWPSFILTFEKTATTTFSNLMMVVGSIVAEAGPRGILRSSLARRFMGRRELNDVINWFKLNRMVRIPLPLIVRMDGGSPDELLIWER